MTWVKGANGVSRWDGGQWPDRELYPEGQKPPKKRGRPRTAKCGTASGYQRHRLDHTVPCEDCTAAVRDYARARKGYKARKPVQCGTTSGYVRHLSRKEIACEACLEAKRNYERDRAQRKRQKENA